MLIFFAAHFRKFLSFFVFTGSRKQTIMHLIKGVKITGGRIGMTGQNARIKALVFWTTTMTPYMPFSHISSCISSCFQLLTKGNRRQRQSMFGFLPVQKARNTETHRILAAENGGARWHTTWMRRISIIKAHSLSCQTIHIGRFI